MVVIFIPSEAIIDDAHHSNSWGIFMDMMLCAKTLGRGPGCVVMNIGAVLFDRTGHDPSIPLQANNQFYAPISALDSHDLGLTTMPETLRWWQKQASWHLIGDEFMNSNSTVADVCDQLSEFIDRHKPEKIWSNSPAFHIGIISELYKRTNKQLPISHRHEMDFRTLMDLVYVERDTRPQISHTAGYPIQHAIGDSISQAGAIASALAAIDASAGELLNKQRWTMIDIETLGVKRGCSILSIGASRFGAINDTGVTLNTDSSNFYTVINSFDSQSNGFTTEAKTLQWWKNEPIWKDLSVEICDSTVGVRQACMQFAKYITKEMPHKIWANSPRFDIELLRVMFKKMKVDFPIAYRQEMDFRTLMELAYPNRDDRPEPEMGAWLPAHHALGDAQQQALQTQKALIKLGLTAQPDNDAAYRAPRKISAPLSRRL